MPSLPLEHLSASSLSLHARCPRQWQDKYIHGNRGDSNSSLVIGSAVHLGLSRLFSGVELGDPFTETVENEESNIRWKDDYLKSKGIYEAHLYHYWEQVGKHLTPLKTEQELLFEIEGVDIPILAYVDLETPDVIIDFKTTAYFNRKSVRVNKEWIFQQGVYQLVIPKPSEVHILTRAKIDPILVPDNEAHPLHFGRIDTEKIASIVRDEWGRIKYYWETYGEDKPWPGNSLHEWAKKYCGVERCCAL